MVDRAAYPSLKLLLDGQYSIREISAKTNKSALTVGVSFLKYIRSGHLRLVDLVDFDDPVVVYNQQLKEDPPLIACIDDSILIYQSLESILTKHGYRSYGIQDPLKIMPSLIRNKPNFIFLDLLMPIVNGYEVCEQIRKTPSLKDIPVIILTGKDGLIDRMRSKMVGATGFLGKPVNEESVMQMLEKYLIVGK